MLDQTAGEAVGEEGGEGEGSECYVSATPHYNKGFLAKLRLATEEQQQRG